MDVQNPPLSLNVVQRQSTRLTIGIADSDAGKWLVQEWKSQGSGAGCSEQQ